MESSVSASAVSAARRYPVWIWLVAWMIALVGGSVLLHWSWHGVVNGWQITLAFFLAINLLICGWEISLWHRIADIRRWFHDPRGSDDRPRGNLYTTPVSAREFASTRLWARTWLGYAYWDDGYADPKSFGFAIDVGNGFSTALPSAFFLVAMTVPLVSPVVLGIVGLLLFYQKFYCTCLYFFQYFYNQRWRERSLGGLIGVVGGTNSAWLVFPAIGFYVSVRLVVERSFDVLR